MSIWLTIGLVLAAIAAGLPLSIWLTAPIRRNRGAFAFASALFFAYGPYNPTPDTIEEAREDDALSKRQRSGDPPEPGSV